MCAFISSGKSPPLRGAVQPAVGTDRPHTAAAQPPDRYTLKIIYSAKLLIYSFYYDA